MSCKKRKTLVSKENEKTDKKYYIAIVSVSGDDYAALHSSPTRYFIKSLTSEYTLQSITDCSYMNEHGIENKHIQVKEDVNDENENDVKSYFDDDETDSEISYDFDLFEFTNENDMQTAYRLMRMVKSHVQDYDDSKHKDTFCFTFCGNLEEDLD